MLLLQKILFVLYTLTAGLTGSLLFSAIGGGKPNNLLGIAFISIYLALYIFFAVFLYKKPPRYQNLFLSISAVSLLAHTLLTLILIYVTVRIFFHPIGDENGGSVLLSFGLISFLAVFIFCLFYSNLYVFKINTRLRWIYFLPLILLPGLLFSICYSGNKTDTAVPSSAELRMDISGEKTGAEPLIAVEYVPDPILAKSQVYNTCQPFVKTAMSEFTTHSDEDFEESVQILDEENMYILMFPRWWEGSATCTLFTLPDETLLLAYTINSCGPICHQDRGFYTQVDTEWKDVSSEVLPDMEEKLAELRETYENFNPILELPRYGTSIVVSEQYSGEELFKLLWGNGHFTIND